MRDAYDIILQRYEMRSCNNILTKLFIKGIVQAYMQMFIWRLVLDTAPKVVWAVVPAQLYLLLLNTERDVLIRNVHT